MLDPREPNPDWVIQELAARRESHRKETGERGRKGKKFEEMGRNGKKPEETGTNRKKLEEKRRNGM